MRPSPWSESKLSSSIFPFFALPYLIKSGHAWQTDIFRNETDIDTKHCGAHESWRKPSWYSLVAQIFGFPYSLRDSFSVEENIAW
jgi:hypothetical protein